tara:strand:- start:223 stop:2178 length:1956 start_codon:yes stop_codon:yes gene_type:complete
VKKDKTKETLNFQTEVQQLLHLMIHSLYSNKEIFLRELISNASDAADKLRFKSLSNSKLLENEKNLNIHIIHSKKEKTIDVIDNGIGMSRKELIDNLGTIAKSGTAEFLKKRTGDQKKDAQLIGQFGVGFYSSFIVAERVVVESRKAGLPKSKGVRWESDGQGNFTVENIVRETKGTKVTLYLKPSEVEFLDHFRLETLIKKYSDHIAFAVSLEDKNDEGKEAITVNSATAIWNRSRTEVKDKEYIEFYKHLSHDFEDPITWSHNRVEGKREYISLLFIPSRAPFDLWNRDAPKGLKLYVQRVFIMDDAEQFLPLYLRFIKGIVDCADLPLNISRELLQKNSEIDAMKSALTRRALDMITKLSSKNSEKGQETYKKFWKEFGHVIKEGLVEDTANKEKLMGLLRFASSNSNTDEQDRSLSEYLAEAPKKQDKIYYLLADNNAAAKSNPHLEQLKSKGIEVLLLTDRIDPWIVDHLPEFEGKKFQNVGKGEFSLSDEGKKVNKEELKKEHELFLKKISKTLEDRVEKVNLSQRLVDSPSCVVAGQQDITPQMRRMLEATGQKLPESKPVLEINLKHPLIKKLFSESNDKMFISLSNIILDHALLADGEQLTDPSMYLKRMNDLLLDAMNGKKVSKKKVSKKKVSKKKAPKKG